MKKVLIVDDDRHIAEALSIRLKHLGYDPQIEHNGVSGICSALEEYPDFLILDINMPSGDGYFMAQTLSDRLSNNHSIPFVFITASALPETRSLGLGLGAIEVFEKPFQFERLVSVIEANT